MSKIDENEIRRRLERISRIEPTPDATSRAVERVRQTLESQSESRRRPKSHIWRLIFASSLTRSAAAAAVLIAAGYLAGRLSAPQPPDIRELEAALEHRLRSSLEPAVREELSEELNRSWQTALAVYHAGLSEQLNAFAAGLGEQHRRELNEYAVKTLNASSAVTHQLLNDLVQAIASAQEQDRQWVTIAMRHIESNRIKDTMRLNTGLVSLAEQTRGELTRTKQGLAQLYSVVSPDGAFPDAQEHQQPQ